MERELISRHLIVPRALLFVLAYNQNESKPRINPDFHGSLIGNPGSSA